MDARTAGALGALLISTTMPRAAELDNVAAVSAGEHHTCVLTTTGGVKCWGQNIAGQLGNGTFEDHPTPVDVIGLGSGVADIATGAAHTCALTTSGAVKCWGSNYFGQIGFAPGSPLDNVATPTDVPGLQGGVIAISSSNRSFSTCALTSAGAAKCWGYNGTGQLGRGTQTQVEGVGDVTVVPAPIARIAIGGGHACAEDAGGGLKCWGNGMQGQLGNGVQEIRSDAVGVSGLASGVGAFDIDEWNNCAVVAPGGAMKCWGYLFIDNQPYELVPTGVAGLDSGVASVSVGSIFRCAVTSAGGLKCWGSISGDGTSVIRYSPVDVLGLTSGVVQVSAGSGHACAVTSAGKVKCWGETREGEVGNRTVSEQPVYAPVTVLWFAPQSIDFAALADHDLAASPFQVVAVATSALPVSFTSLTPWSCTVSGTTVTLVSAGTCAIAADQAGDDTYDIAPRVVRSFKVLSTSASQPRLFNLSTRGLANPSNGDNSLIAGFVIGGDSPKTVVLRVLGRSLDAFGLNGILNPSVRIHAGSTFIGSNDQWARGVTDGGSLFASPAAVSATGFAPAYENEVAVIATLPPGGYTAVVSNWTGFDQLGDAVGLIELYELDKPAVPLLNISTRGRVGTGSNVMIAGFVVVGDGPLTVVVTGKGPSLSQFGVSGVLADPTLTLVRQSDGAVLATNDDWPSAPNAGSILGTGFAPSHRNEAAMLVTLPPGAYTAILSGAGGSTGIGLVEVYRVSN